MKHLVYTFIFSMLFTAVRSQDFIVEISKDTVLAGNTVKVAFKATNLQGNIESPELQGVQIISGPNVKSSSFYNGQEMTSSKEYSYQLLTEQAGEIIIPPAFLKTDDEVYETEPTTIIVLPNPEGIIEEPPAESGIFNFDFNPFDSQKVPSKEKNQKKRKKRKLRKL